MIKVLLNLINRYNIFNRNSSEGRETVVSAKTIANIFIDLASKENKKLTNLQLQKLVYIAHGFCLGFLGIPLYYNETRAWQFGPVIPDLYRDLQKYGSGLVLKRLTPIELEDDLKEEIDKESNEHQIVAKVWEVYKKYTGGQLSALTHLDDTPWDKTFKDRPFGVITNSIIEKYYKEVLAAQHG